MDDQNKIVPLGKFSVRIAVRDLDLIQEIADRAVSINSELDPLHLMMDLVSVHTRVGKLRLKEMADPEVVDDFNLMHDVYGISAHLNRSTLELEGFFLPRCMS